MSSIALERHSKVCHSGFEITSCSVPAQWAPCSISSRPSLSCPALASERLRSPYHTWHPGALEDWWSPDSWHANPSTEAGCRLTHSAETDTSVKLTGMFVAPSLSHRLMHFRGSVDWYRCLLNGSSPHPTTVVEHFFILFNLVRLLATAGDDCVTGRCFGFWEHCFWPCLSVAIHV